MPYLFLVIGVFFVTAGVRGKTSDLLTLLKGDLYGKQSFLPWVLAMAVLGGLGYIQDLRPLSHALLALVVIVLLLSHGGFFEQFTNTIEQVA